MPGRRNSPWTNFSPGGQNDMTASELLQATMHYGTQLAPFAFVFSIIACGEELAELIRKVVVKTSSKW